MKKKILIVEDELDLTLSIDTRLRMAGFKTKTAEDGVVALELLKKEEFDLIIMDIMMPNMDGLSFAAILNSRDDTRNIPVIVLTARSDDEAKEIFEDLGAAAYLVKPYDPRMLLQKIHEALEWGKIKKRSKYA